MTEQNTNATEIDSTSEGIAPKVSPSQGIVYVSTTGKQKAAIVINTPESITEGTSLPALLPGQVHLVVWDWSAMHFTPRLNVPFEDLVVGNTEFAGADGQPVGSWRLA